MLSPLKVIVISAGIIGSTDPIVSCNKYTIGDEDYSITAREYMLKVNPPPKNPNDILYELILEELLSNP